MPDPARYTGLSIENKRYDRLRREFDGIVQATTNMTFTNWSVTAIESAVERQKYISKHFADFKMVSVEKGTMILFDMKLKKAVTISIGGDAVSCSEKEGRDRYVLYATLHPLMVP